jgi:ribose transport system ATP-binding protein
MTLHDTEEPTTRDTPVLAVKAVAKRFGGVHALRGVDFDLRAGEVHALIGENGAGKSTLIKVLAGLHRPSAGHVELRGLAVSFFTPLDAQRAGIAVVSQEFTLVPQLSIAENIFLGREPRRAWRLIDWKTARRRSRELLHEFGLEVDPREPVASLSVADQQLVEIAKALSQDPPVLIMDEPTAALNAAEVERLLLNVVRLRERGVAVVYVSHRLPEIVRISDRITVLRDGSHVATLATSTVTEDRLVTLMLGHELAAATIEHHPVSDEKPLLAVEGLSAGGYFQDIAFDVRPGEILGVAGLIGSGRSELMRALFGLLTPTSGRVVVDGRPLEGSDPRDSLARGVFLLSEDRKADGILPDLSVRENLFLTAVPAKSRSKWRIDADAERAEYAQVKDFLDIRAHTADQPVPTLSGGNQQKVLLGRALVSRARVLLLNEPTRGVDVGAKVDIYTAVRKLADSGAAVVVSSSDAPELAKLSDRCLVLNRGKAVRLLGSGETDEDAIIAAAVRGTEQEFGR